MYTLHFAGCVWSVFLMFFDLNDIKLMHFVCWHASNFESNIISRTYFIFTLLSDAHSACIAMWMKIIYTHGTEFIVRLSMFVEFVIRISFCVSLKVKGAQNVTKSILMSAICNEHLMTLIQHIAILGDWASHSFVTIRSYFNAWNPDRVFNRVLSYAYSKCN